MIWIKRRCTIHHCSIRCLSYGTSFISRDIYWRRSLVNFAFTLVSGWVSSSICHVYSYQPSSTYVIITHNSVIIIIILILIIIMFFIAIIVTTLSRITSCHTGQHLFNRTQRTCFGMTNFCLLCSSVLYNFVYFACMYL